MVLGTVIQHAVSNAVASSTVCAYFRVAFLQGEEESSRLAAIGEQHTQAIVGDAAEVTGCMNLGLSIILGWALSTVSMEKAL